MFVIAALIGFFSSSPAQTNGAEMPMGDTWPSGENSVYVPRDAVMPGAMEEERIIVDDNPSPFQGLITLKLRKTSSPRITPHNSPAARLKSGKHSTGRHARPRCR
jgi:hypothetical protein